MAVGNRPLCYFLKCSAHAAGGPQQQQYGPPSHAGAFAPPPDRAGPAPTSGMGPSGRPPGTFAQREDQNRQEEQRRKRFREFKEEKPVSCAADSLSTLPIRVIIDCTAQPASFCQKYQCRRDLTEACLQGFLMADFWLVHSLPNFLQDCMSLSARGTCDTIKASTTLIVP